MGVNNTSSRSVSYTNTDGTQSFASRVYIQNTNDVAVAQDGPWVSGVNVSGLWIELYANSGRERTTVTIQIPSGGSAGVAGAPYVFLGPSGSSISNCYILASGISNERSFACQSGVRIFGITESNSFIANIRILELL